MRITKENTSAVFIDIQEKLVPVMNEKETLLEHIQILLQGLQVLEIPLVFTQQYTKGLGETIEPLQSLIPNFSPVEKSDFSCYGSTEFKEFLRTNKSKQVILCGIEAHVCVLQTAIDLKEAGFTPIVITDCISARTSANVEIALERLRHEQIMTSGYESILFELTRTSQSESFKAISRLVK
jgi:nicotinamidase-related amidase